MHSGLAAANRWRWRVRDEAKLRLASAESRLRSGAVALTFDDGPWPGATDRVLDVLGELGVVATFFCVGANARRHPDLLRRIRAEGHAVGSHSLRHPTPHATPIAALRREYLHGRAAVEDILGEPVSLFRPPHGQLSLASAAVIHQARMKTWLWTLDPQDYLPGRPSADIVAVASAAGPGDVILMHDWLEEPTHASALDRSATVAALPEIVSRIRSRGLELESLAA